MAQVAYKSQNTDTERAIRIIEQELSRIESGISASDLLRGASSTGNGTAGITPAAKKGEQTYFLRGDGTWAAPEYFNLSVASATTLGGVKVGNGLSIDANGVLSATVTDTNNYITGISGDGDSTITITREGLADITHSLAHSHSEYITGISNEDTVGEGLVADTTGSIYRLKGGDNITIGQEGNSTDTWVEIDCDINTSNFLPSNTKRWAYLKTFDTDAFVDTVTAGQGDSLILDHDNSNVALTTGTVTDGGGTTYNAIRLNVTHYTHPTTAGNKHIPTGGSSGQFLGYSASGTAQWVNNPNTNLSDADISAMGYIKTYTDTNTNQLTTWNLKDDDADNHNLGHGVHVKIVGGGSASVTTDWTASTQGSELDPHILTISATDTTYSAMGSGNSYASGLVPSGASTHGNTYLRKDGTWGTPLNTQLSDADIGALGYIKTYTDTDTIDMGDGFKFVDGSGSVSVTENNEVKIVTQNSGSHGTGALSGSGSDVDPYVITLNTPNTITDTTYSTSWVDSGTNAILRLTAGGSGSGNDDLTLLAGNNITLTPNGDNLTITGNNTTNFSLNDATGVTAGSSQHGLILSGAGGGDSAYLRNIVAGTNITITTTDTDSDTGYIKIDASLSGATISASEVNPLGGYLTYTASNLRFLDGTNISWALANAGSGIITVTPSVDLSGYSTTSHNHSGVYAPASHTHSYLPLSGGTLSGAIDFSGRNVKLDGSAERTELFAVVNKASSDKYVGFELRPKANGGNTSSIPKWCVMAQNVIGFYDDTNNKWGLYTRANAETRLYYNGAEKLATTSSGLSITGSLTGTSASFSGNVKIGSPTGSPLTSDYLQIWGDDNATASKEMLRANSSNHGSYRFQLMHDAVDSSDYGGDVRDIVFQGVNVGFHHVAEGSIKFSTYNGGWQRALTIDTSQNATFSGVIHSKSGSSSVDNIRLYNQNGNYSYIRTTASSNSNNVWFDGMLGCTQWYAWDNPNHARTSGVYTQHYFGVGRGTSNESVRIYRGAIDASGDVTAYYSDARLKDFHGVIENPLDKVMKLNGYYFTENARAKELGYHNDRMQVGVSAQEVREVLPELIKDAHINPDKEIEFEHDYMTIDYGKLTPLLIEAIKELKTELNTLKQEMN